MAIVINEFEAVAEPPAPRTGPENRADGAPDRAPTKIEVHELAAMQQALAQRTLRSWAH